MPTFRAFQSLGPELLALIAQLGVPLTGALRITGLRTTIVARDTFRLSLADGRVLKGRRFPWAETSTRIAATLSELDPRRFARVVASQPHALLEEWVEGTLLAALEPNQELFECCGQWLAELHATQPRSDWHAQRKPDVELERWLSMLVKAGRMSAIVEDRLNEIASRHRPHRFDRGFVHRDLCPENLVLRGATLAPAHVCSIDNGLAAFGPLDEDLARTWYRWPMEDESWQAFLSGYRRTRDPSGFEEHAIYWLATMLARAAIFRVRAGMTTPNRPLEQLELLMKLAPANSTEALRGLCLRREAA